MRMPEASCASMMGESIGKVVISSVMASLADDRITPAPSWRSPSYSRFTNLSTATVCCTSTPLLTARRSIARIPKRPSLAAASASASQA
jgi:hypothetical protein